MKTASLPQLLLFAATFVMTTLVQGPLYAAAIMGILLAHELGHYLQCRRNGVAATLPIFIPMINIFGTMGAVIAIKSPIPNRRALYDIGITGPLVGLLVAVPLAALGLSLSQISPVTIDTKGLSLGEPLLFRAIRVWLIGAVPDGSDVILHPVAFAAWAAMFVTSINFFPVGQLDGGHVVYAMLGRRAARVVSWLVILGLAYLGFAFHPMWYVFLALVILLATRRPAPTDDLTPLDAKRKWLGVLTFLLMAACFSPVPFDLPT